MNLLQETANSDGNVIQVVQGNQSTRISREIVAIGIVDILYSESQTGANGSTL